MISSRWIVPGAVALFLSLNAHADNSDMAKIHELNPVIDKQKIIHIANKVKLETDTRKIYGPDAPEFLETYGRVKINGALDCTGNVVSDDTSKDDVIVTTAAHCFPERILHNLKHIEYSIEFTKRDGTKIVRRMTPYKINKEDDYAIMKLNHPIPNALLKPLLIPDLPYDEVMETENNNVNPFTITYAGYSSDPGKGNGGKNLTYDQDCKMYNTRGFLVDTNCVAYEGASGGAFVITVTDRENNNKVTSYFVGVNHSVSINRYAEKRPEVATFVEHSAMYDDLMEALGASR